jgi:hypothetical protein
MAARAGPGQRRLPAWAAILIVVASKSPRPLSPGMARVFAAGERWHRMAARAAGCRMAGPTARANCHAPTRAPCRRGRRHRRCRLRTAAGLLRPCACQTTGECPAGLRGHLQHSRAALPRSPESLRATWGCIPPRPPGRRRQFLPARCARFCALHAAGIQGPIPVLVLGHRVAGGGRNHRAKHRRRQPGQGSWRSGHVRKLVLCDLHPRQGHRRQQLHVLCRWAAGTRCRTCC